MITTARSQQGSALIVVLVIIMVLASLASFLVSDGFIKWKTAANLTDKSKSLHMAEAGLDRAIGELNVNRSGTLGSDTAPVLWGSGEYYTTAVDWATDGVDNDGVNGIDDPAEEFYYTVTSVGVGDRNTRWPVRATVVAIVQRLPFTGFHRAMFGDIGVTMGGTIFTDSYDSALGPYAVQIDPTAPGHLAACPLCTRKGFVDPSLHTDPLHCKNPIGFRKGDVGSNGNIGDVGTVNVYGNSTAGPGYATLISSNCYVDGSTAPALVPVPLPPVVCTPPAGLPPVPLNGTTASTVTNSVSLAGGTYQCGGIRLANSEFLKISGNVTLYVTGDITLTAKEEVRIAPGAQLKIFHTSGRVSIVGGSNTNSVSEPASLLFFSESTGTINIGGNSTWSGCIYAPLADICPAGTCNYFGSMTGKSIKTQGTADYHYDEALGRMKVLVLTPCEVRAWNETTD